MALKFNFNCISVTRFIVLMQPWQAINIREEITIRNNVLVSHMKTIPFSSSHTVHR